MSDVATQEERLGEPKTDTPEGKSLPKPVQDFIRAIEEGGVFGDCGGGPPYCEIDADICENLCHFLRKMCQLLVSHNPARDAIQARLRDVGSPRFSRKRRLCKKFKKQWAEKHRSTALLAFIGAQ